MSSNLLWLMLFLRHLTKEQVKIKWQFFIPSITEIGQISEILHVQKFIHPNNAFCSTNIYMNNIQNRLSNLIFYFLFLSLQLSAVQQVFGTFFLLLSLHALLSSAILFRTS